MNLKKAVKIIKADLDSGEAPPPSPAEAWLEELFLLIEGTNIDGLVLQRVGKDAEGRNLWQIRRVQ